MVPLLNVDPGMRRALLEHATDFVRSPLPLIWSDDEAKVLRTQVTSLNCRVFFLTGASANIIAVENAQFARMTNSRGLRGIIVDSVLPALLTPFLKEVQKKYADHQDDFSPDLFLKERGIKNLGDFLAHSANARTVFNQFLLLGTTDPDYMARLAGSKKIEGFLKRWTGKIYGHNSILRMGAIYLCAEKITINAAKDIENGRHAGYAELSTRAVDMDGSGVYPIWNEFELLGFDPQPIKAVSEFCFDRYRAWFEGGKEAALPKFFQKTYGSFLVSEGVTQANIIYGAVSEAADVLGNLLPNHTLTSVGMAVLGEGFQTLIKHLRLSSVPESIALAELILAESHKTGSNQFARHIKLTETDIRGWQYLSTKGFIGMPPNKPILLQGMDGRADTALLLSVLKTVDGYEACESVQEVAELLFGGGREAFDKVSSPFELCISITFKGVQSWRSWRDTQRMTKSSHERTLVTPDLGFYVYDKPAPPALAADFLEVAMQSKQLYRKMQSEGAPPILLQLGLPLGWEVGFYFGGNPKQTEFCGFQRTKPEAHHDVRQFFLGTELLLREKYEWWPTITRAHMVQAYVFARGSEVPLAKFFDQTSK